METKKRRKKYVRRTPESYREEVEKITNGEYSVLGDFVNTRTKIKHCHEICGHVWEVSPNSIISSGSRCPECSATTNKLKSNDEFLEEVYLLTGDEYVFLQEYTGNKRKILCRHVVCDHTYLVKPNQFLSGTRCPKCSKVKAAEKLRTPVEVIKRKVVEISGGEYSISGTFKNTHSRAEFLHDTCGCKYHTTVSNFMIGHGRCPNCRNSKSAQEFREFIFEKYGNEVQLLTEFKNHREYVLVKHLKCGSIYHVLPNNLKRNLPCKVCSVNSSRRTPDEFIREVYRLVGDEYVFHGRYVNSKEKMHVTHSTCGKRYSVSPYKFLDGRRCPNCAYSRGEKAVADVLDSLSIEYSREHTFEYLGRKRFDFFIPSLNIAIEYDGEQHYKSIDSWGGEEALKRTQESDALKNDFCDFMGIDLLRIPYWELDNIDEIVTNFIDTVKLMRSISASGSEMSKCR